MDEFGSGHKPSPIDRIPSAASFTVSTPPPLKRLQAFREKLLTYNDDWKYETKIHNEINCPTPKIPSPKCPSPKRSPSLCSPIHHIHVHHCNPIHVYDFDDSCEMNQNHLNHFDSIHEESSSRSVVDHLKTPPKLIITPTEFRPEFHSMRNHKSPITCDIKCTKPKKPNKMRRSKSCPKDLFSISSKYSDNEKSVNDSIEMNERHLCRDNNNLTPCYTDGFNSSRMSRHQNPYRKSIPKHHRIQKSKSKTPNSMDEYVQSKLVRINHAAELRQKRSRQKIHELAEEKLKENMHVSEFIPKCHKWNVRDTPAWKTFLSEE